MARSYVVLGGEGHRIEFLLRVQSCYEEMVPGRSEVAGPRAPDEFACTLPAIHTLAWSCKAVRM